MEFMPNDYPIPALRAPQVPGQVMIEIPMEVPLLCRVIQSNHYSTGDINIHIALQAHQVQNHQALLERIVKVNHSGQGTTLCHPYDLQPLQLHWGPEVVAIANNCRGEANINVHVVAYDDSAITCTHTGVGNINIRITGVVDLNKGSTLSDYYAGAGSNYRHGGPFGPFEPIYRAGPYPFDQLANIPQRSFSPILAFGDNTVHYGPDGPGGHDAPYQVDQFLNGPETILEPQRSIASHPQSQISADVEFFPGADPTDPSLGIISAFEARAAQNFVDTTATMLPVDDQAPYTNGDGYSNGLIIPTLASSQSNQAPDDIPFASSPQRSKSEAAKRPSGRPRKHLTQPPLLKCQKCFVRRRWCDGKRPCGTCRNEGRSCRELDTVPSEGNQPSSVSASVKTNRQATLMPQSSLGNETHNAVSPLPGPQPSLQNAAFTAPIHNISEEAYSGLDGVNPTALSTPLPSFSPTKGTNDGSIPFPPSRMMQTNVAPVALVAPMPPVTGQTYMAPNDANSNGQTGATPHVPQSTGTYNGGLPDLPQQSQESLAPANSMSAQAYSALNNAYPDEQADTVPHSSQNNETYNSGLSNFPQPSQGNASPKNAMTWDEDGNIVYEPMPLSSINPNREEENIDNYYVRRALHGSILGRFQYRDGFLVVEVRGSKTKVFDWKNLPVKVASWPVRYVQGYNEEGILPGYEVYELAGTYKGSAERAEA